MLVFEADEAARWILAIAAVGIAVATAEDLRRFSIFSDGGLLSWQVLQLSTRATAEGVTWRWISRLFRPTVFRAALLFRLFVAGALAVTAVIGWGPSYLFVIGSLGLFLATALISLRSRGFGLDGAHQMNLIILGHMAVFWSVPADSAIRPWCLVILGLHAVLAYVASGVFKAIGPMWRRGDAISGIMGAKIYGHRQMGRFLNSHRGLSFLVCWFTIVFEVSFVAAPFSDSGTLSALLAIGLIFHMANAVLMGLGGFLFAFVATYPAIVFLNSTLVLGY